MDEDGQIGEVELQIELLDTADYEAIMDKINSIGEEITTTTESTTVVTTTEDETVEETITTDETECVENYTYNEETEECEFDDAIDVDETESTKGEDSKSSGGKSGGGKSGSRGPRASDYDDDSTGKLLWVELSTYGKNKI